MSILCGRLGLRVSTYRTAEPSAKRPTWWVRSQHFLFMWEIEQFFGPSKRLLQNIIWDAMVDDVDEPHSTSGVRQFLRNLLLLLRRTIRPRSKIDNWNGALSDGHIAYVRLGNRFTDL